MQKRRVGFIGAGNMATALIEGILKQRALLPEDVRASDPSESRRLELAERLNVVAEADNRTVLDWAEVLVLATKPQVVDRVMQEAAGRLRAGQLLVSICAGVPLSRLEAHCPEGVHLVRAMPNTPALVGAGATALALGPGVHPEDATFCREMFECVGECLFVEERLMDAVTGLSGSGPAYVLLLLEALADGGVQAGLPRDTAQRLAAQTVRGTAELLQQTGEHPAMLKDRVTSPGGTTIYGLAELEAKGVRHALMSAVVQAAARSRDLGKLT